MMFKVSGVSPYKGFKLGSCFHITENVSLLTGKNGSGKTRFLESIPAGASSLESYGEVMSVDYVKLIPHASLVPSLNYGYNAGSKKENLAKLISTFKKNIDCIDDEHFPNLGEMMAQRHEMPLGTAHKIVKQIANRLGVLPSQLTTEEIEFYYDDVSLSLFDFNGVGIIFNDYAWRLHQNEYNYWLSTVKQRKGKYFISEDDFKKEFGVPPWVLLNEILADTFEGKFKFVEPDIDDYDPLFHTSIVDVLSGEVISVEQLSAGEKSLLWLALVLFNTQFSLARIPIIPKILLLDEPDAFLHPSMVAVMFRCLRTVTQHCDVKIVITTHSPTTVALADADSVYQLAQGEVTKIEQDEAISNLLIGVTQISISPHNRRQVYVESFNDVNVYEVIYREVAHRSNLLDPKVTLMFVRSGPKMPEDVLRDKLAACFGELPEEQIASYLAQVNGVGNSSQVKALVKHQIAAKNETIRGLVDRDGGADANKANEYLKVIGDGVCYAVDNLLFDPVSVVLALRLIDPREYSLENFCGKNVSLSVFLESEEDLQNAVDTYLKEVLGSDNARDHVISYVGGMKLKTDKRYLNHNGHKLWSDHIRKKYVKLHQVGRDEDKIKMHLVRSSMIGQTECRFIPMAFIDAFRQLQEPLRL